jgi:phage gpG-like protein
MLRKILERFATTARVRIGGEAVTGFMIDAPGATGRNEQTGAGTLRRITGRLAKSFIDQRSPESIFKFNFDGQKATITIGSNVPYAAVHEYGFEGAVNIPQHQRRITKAFGRQITPKEITVSSHIRNMNIPARPYLIPAASIQLPILQKLLEEKVLEYVKNAGQA